MRINPKDIKIEYFKSRGPGGQHKNKRFSAVRVMHLPTRLTAIATEQRSQKQNKEIALQRIFKKIAKLNRKKKKRIPTRIPKAVKRRILELKRKRSEKKRLRHRVREDEW